jgi:hypothetical protein
MIIVHCVFCSFRKDVSPVDRTRILQELCDFSATLTGVLSFDFGPNRDFEKKSQAYNGGFVIRFAHRAALKAYAVHPTHRELGERLVDLAEDGAQGIVVFDLEVD